MADRRANPIVHSTKLFGGRETAMQLHRRLAWNNKPCSGCGAPPSLHVQVFVFMNDMSATTRMDVEFEVALGRIKLAKFPMGEALKTSEVYACSRCVPAVERAIAHKAPSYAFVARDYGPGEDKPMVQVVA